MSVNLITVQKREKELDAPGVSIRFDEEKEKAKILCALNEVSRLFERFPALYLSK